MRKDGKLTKDATTFQDWCDNRGLKRLNTHIPAGLYNRYKRYIKYNGYTIQHALESHMRQVLEEKDLNFIETIPKAS